MWYVDPDYNVNTPPRPKTTAEEAAYRAAAEFPRQALHAWLLGFRHPTPPY